MICRGDASWSENEAKIEAKTEAKVEAAKSESKAFLTTFSKPPSIHNDLKARLGVT